MERIVFIPFPSPQDRGSRALVAANAEKVHCLDWIILSRAFGEARYGRRDAVVEARDRGGPADRTRVSASGIGHRELRNYE